MLSEPIKLPVYYNTDETTRLEDLEIDYTLDIEQLDSKDAYFYNIDTVLPANDDMDNPYSRITVGGELFSIALTIEQLIKEIKKQRYGGDIQDY